jgi:TolB-like protein
MQTDESGTMTLVSADFARMRDLCARHGGEVLNSMGDGLLLCFGSVVEAVSWALEVQAEFARRPGTALQHRMGIHLGDVLRREGQIAGDGVNIAARLQTKARPGSVCVSQSVYEAVRGKLPFHVQALGPQVFKNIAEPITVFLVSPAGVAPAARSASPVPAVRHRPVWLAAGVAGAVLLAVTVMLAVRFWPRPAPVVAPQPAAPVDDKSIAVLPFTNMSDDKENAYFADGVHEDLLTHLANLGALKVISRTSMLQYRGTTKPLRQIGAELGVAYILEGSVRRSGNKIRVTGQLINTRTDEHVWAHAYDRDLTDVFAVQAELAHSIAEALQAVLTPQENARLEKRPTQSLAAYQLYQQAMAILRKGDVTEVALGQALPLLKQAVELDPHYAKAWAAISSVEIGAYNGDDQTAGHLARARQALAQAEASDPDDYDVLMAGSNLGAIIGDRPLVSHYRQRVIELFPNRAEAFFALSLNASYEARYPDALAAMAKARSLDPLNVDMLITQLNLLITVRRYDEAAEVNRTIVSLAPENLDAVLQQACTPFLHTGSTRELEALAARVRAAPDQKDPFIRNLRVQIALFREDDPDELIRLWRDGVQSSSSNDLDVNFIRVLVAAAYMSRHDFASARPLIEQNRDAARQQLAREPNQTDALNQLGLALGMLGETQAARAALAQARANLEGQPPVKVKGQRWTNVMARAWAGEKAESIAGFVEILHSPAMASIQTNVFRLQHSFLVLPLHGDPAFEAMVKDPANNAPLF